MSFPDSDPPSAPQTSLRVLVVVMLAALVIGAVFFRGSAADDGGSDDTTPVAGATTSTVGNGTTTTTAADGLTSVTLDGDSGIDPVLPPLREVRLELVFDGFRQPSGVTAPAGDDRLFVLQRVGVIRILDKERVMADPAFLDISDRVLSSGIEQGLLGLAFHPDYASNGRFFVYFTDKGGRRQLSEFSTSASDPDRALADSEKVLIELEQPPDATDIRHYGGQVVFGPDGYLWLALGDGADSRAQGQDSDTLFGSIIRIDVDNGDPYAVPIGNPFVAGGGAPEVWAYGLRNPWRFSIDPVDRLIYIGDVGHADQEEVDVLSIDEGGANLGWSDMEGTRCFHKQDCEPSDYTSPVITYSHEVGLSITGGFVYRGAEIPELDGIYFYSDWVSQWIRSFKYVDGQVTEEKDWTDEIGGPVGQINSFGLDGFGELYFVTHEGQVYRFTAVR